MYIIHKYNCISESYKDTRAHGGHNGLNLTQGGLAEEETVNSTRGPGLTGDQGGYHTADTRHSGWWSG